MARKIFQTLILLEKIANACSLFLVPGKRLALCARPCSRTAHRAAGGWGISAESRAPLTDSGKVKSPGVCVKLWDLEATLRALAGRDVISCPAPQEVKVREGEGCHCLTPIAGTSHSRNVLARPPAAHRTGEKHEGTHAGQPRPLCPQPIPRKRLEVCTQLRGYSDTQHKPSTVPENL